MVRRYLEGLRIEQLLRWQNGCFFLAIFLLPFSPPLYTNSFLGSFSQGGHLSSLPILIGLALACITFVKEGKSPKFLLPASIFAFLYMLMISVISIHALIGFDGYTEKVLGVTPKILIVKHYLAQIGIADEKYAYQVLIFIKDLRNGLSELIYIFGFVAWVSVLYLKQKEKIFLLAQKAILLDFFLLLPYVTTEVFHLYGCRSATEILTVINPFFYVPLARTGWYPPVVSWNQIRGVWTEPAYFSIWLAFAVPFLFYWATRSGGVNLKLLLARGLLFFVVFCIWFMTYARTSIYLAGATFLILVSIAFYLRSKVSLIHGTLLIIAFILAFIFVSNFGPQDVSRWRQNSVATVSVQKQHSSFIENTVKSTVSVDSRSTPSRVQYWIARLLVFRDSPLLGRGDSFEVYYETQNYSTFGVALTPELKNRLKWIERNGIFNAGFGGNGIDFTSLLACRGLVGLSFYVVPILFFFFFFLRGIHREKDRNDKKLALCLFCSTSVVALTFFVQGLHFLDFWCSCGVGVGWMLSQNTKNGQSFPVRSQIEC